MLYSSQDKLWIPPPDESYHGSFSFHLTNDLYRGNQSGGNNSPLGICYVAYIQQLGFFNSSEFP